MDFVLLLRTNKRIYFFYISLQSATSSFCSKNIIFQSFYLLFFSLFRLIEVTVFGSASEGFSQKIIKCSIEESLKWFKNVFDASKNYNMKIQGLVLLYSDCVTFVLFFLYIRPC